MKAYQVVLIVALFFVLVTGLMLYPLPLKMADHVFELGDTLLNAWIIAWDCHKFSTTLNNFFDANILYPTKNSLACSEHLLATALVVYPVQLIFRNIVLTYNTAFFYSIFITGFGNYLLMRFLLYRMEYKNDRQQNYKPLWRIEASAILAGFILAYCPYHFAHIGHLQLQNFGYLPISLIFLIKSFDTFRWRDTFLAWLFFLLQALSSFYYAYFSLIVWFVMSLFLLWQFRKNLLIIMPKHLLAAILCFCLMLPISKPYWLQKETLNVQTIHPGAYKLSARLRDFGWAPQCNLIYSQLNRKFNDETIRFQAERQLFFGFLIPVLALIGIFISFKQKEDRFILIFLVLSLISFILSLGPVINISGMKLILPYSYLTSLIPGFSVIRSPARFSFLVIFGLSILCGYTSYKICSLKNFSVQVKKVIPIALCTIILLEFWNKPFEMQKLLLKNEIPAIYQWLANQEVQEPILILPFSDNFMEMYYSTYHFKKMANGWSGYIGSSWWEFLELIEKFPEEKTLRFLQLMGFRTIIVHKSKEEGSELAYLLEKTSKSSEFGLNIIKDFGTDMVYSIKPISPSEPDLDFELKLSPWLAKNRTNTASIYITNPSPEVIFWNDQKNCEFEVLWKNFYNQKEILLKQKIDGELPTFFSKNEWFDLSFPVTLPKEAGIYLVNIHCSKGLFQKSFSLSKKIIINSHPVVADSWQPSLLRVKLDLVECPQQVQPKEEFEILIKAQNTGNTIWRSAEVPEYKIYNFRKGCIAAGVRHWMDEKNQEVTDFPKFTFSPRQEIPYDVNSGETVLLKIKTLAPKNPGFYTLEVDLTDEGFCWFSDRNGKSLNLEIKVSKNFLKEE